MIVYTLMTPCPTIGWYPLCSGLDARDRAGAQPCTSPFLSFRKGVLLLLEARAPTGWGSPGPRDEQTFTFLSSFLLFSGRDCCIGLCIGDGEGEGRHEEER